MTAPHPVGRYWVVTCIAWLSTSAGAASTTLAPGPSLEDCRSALHPGPVQCGPLSIDASEARGPGAADSRPAREPDGLERRVDAFLADYGKPPREAIRALLEPTDEHVRALLMKHEETIALASYLASRMTALRARDSSAPNEVRGALERSAAMLGMRATLFERPENREAAQALNTLATVARAFPALRATVALVGSFTAQELRRAISRVPAPVTATTLRPDQCDADALPYVLLEDTRAGREVRLDGRNLEPSDLEAQILAFRSYEDGVRDPGREGATPASLLGEGRVDAN